MTRAEHLGLSSQRLMAFDDRLNERYVASGRLPGAVTLIHRRGECAHVNVVGSMDVERAKPMREDAIFRIYSMTKPITSVAFMTLVEQGLVALDDPVSSVIPAWKNLGVAVAGARSLGGFQTRPVGREMLMVDLLRHTAGLSYFFQARTNVDAAYRELALGEPTNPGGLDGMIDCLSQLPLDYSPGDEWNYSVATHVLGYLVEKISGQPFADYLKHALFDPIGMPDTGFFVPDDKVDRFCACYRPSPSGGLILQDDPATSQFRQMPALASGGSGLVSTAGDYLRFCRMLLDRGSIDGRQILSPKTVELMTINHLPGGRMLDQMSRSTFSEAVYPGLGFGLGFAVTQDLASTMQPGSVGDYFWGGGASTAFWIDPVEDLIVVFMTQLLPSTTYKIRRDLRHWVYGAMCDGARVSRA
ncbi:class A beta-lactamase-related serine hydrolase [Burkholderia multivorans]|uniref:serine hydrolase domain-containing protein n=1 Tax=Burkholderia ubonensis TaxID=101571 RepID=UPI000F708453|nr:serine hydrolase domain-containing protein [Burkholderia ubonensis]AYZ64191.1 class A beta-lactamase-related serine hydrolase [Burkholderia multivorans]VWB27997.1 serine hydrolase [Burkholderia ubonensis]